VSYLIALSAKAIKTLDRRIEKPKNASY